MIPSDDVVIAGNGSSRKGAKARQALHCKQHPSWGIESFVKNYSVQKQITQLDPALRELRLKDLEVFTVAARMGSFRLAAREFQLEPSQVSRTVRAIEKKIGESLFHRAASGVSLTPSGQRVLEVVLTLLNQSRFLRGKKNKVPEAMAFHGLASANYLVQNLLPECIADLGRAKSELNFRVLELFPDQMLFPAMRGAFEIALHAGAIEWPHSWLSEEVGSIEWGFYARPEHPLFKMKKPKDRPEFLVEELLEFPFILPFDFSGEAGFRFRDDRSPIPLNLRRSGSELQRADVAVEILARTDQLAHLPSIVTYRLVSERKLRKIRLAGVAPVHVPLFLSVLAATVSAKVLESLKISLRRQLEACREIQTS